MITVPAEFATRFANSEHPAERQWIADLPQLVRHHCARWSLTLDGDPLHGYVALVVPVRTAEGTPAMLKLSWPEDEESADEPIALAAWQGGGAVLLLDRDDENGVLLLERLDPAHSLDAEPIDEAVTIAAGLLRRLVVPAPPLRQHIRDLAEWWTEDLPAENKQFGEPVPAALLDTVVGYCRELGPNAADLLVNRDLHYQNVLRGQREPWLLIDPKPVAGDPEFGVIPLLWNRFEDIEASGADLAAGVRARFAAIVEAAELDAELARRWTLVRAVDNWLWELSQPATVPSVAALVAIANALHSGADG